LQAVILDSQWVKTAAEEIARDAERELEALVGVSSPSGDSTAADEVVAVAAALLPGQASIERIECSSPGHARDLLARLEGGGSGRIVLLGHLDTVVPHSAHRPLERDGDRLVGSGAIDMKGGDALAIGLMRALAKVPEAFAEIAALLVVDEEWRAGSLAHGPRFAGFDACLCFEAGELTAGGDDALIVRRKAAGTLRVRAEGVAAHSGAAPHLGRNALLALAEAASRVAAMSDPGGPRRLTAVPTILRSGEAFNVVPATGELTCDLRADALDAFAPVLAALPAEHGGVSLEAAIVREWPGMDTSAAAAPVLERAGALIGRPLVGTERGGASDASHLAAHVPITFDGLGPIGANAHNPCEYLSAGSLLSRAEVACAVAATALAGA
jgi:glutamate carboxypeptidase